MRDWSLSLSLNREDIRLGEVKMTSNFKFGIALFEQPNESSFNL